MQVVQKCNLCGGASFREILRGQDLMYLTPGEFKLVACKCGLHFINPQPTELAKYYPKEYYSISNKIKRSKLSELAYFTFFSEQGSKILRLFLYPVYPLLRGTKVIRGKKILDIGCGSGVFLSRMKNLGMQVTGVDPYIKRDISELGVVKGTLDELSGKYNVITMNNVLEHVTDPDKTMAHIKRLLAKKGTVVIGVPQFRSLLFRLFKNRWAELDMPRHLFLYDEKTLRKYALKNGLEVSHARYNCVPFEFTGTIFYFLNKYRRPRKLSESVIAKSKFVSLLFLPLCHLFALLKIGGRIEVTLKHANEKYGA